ncbi:RIBONUCLEASE P PROTEIN SUBUNIT P38-LIKE PROTEIN [Salix viminalis]|uniref:RIBONUCLEASE P PROTEIN SUBUNIT P38-LIKE PROTEIN n=1 Tax=Salix viminalis TaxID=40686 RepID=A0A9Q0SDJ2_SALVM|nr:RIBONUCLEASE P PROTEIN SUBUNIT P38-LIKE PROTEIN [Salix viminalis]KAJ6672874.1 RIBONUCLEASE P PROTEIN SUBUNIT P38-LIKE PROTEIN [Salix viminalis]KAJ6672875.1 RIBONUCLEASE P PROTEIN SUBUNIT P38-LIKE PROTEIN [Salix viminalis]KAJ6672876.1 RIBONUCLEASE P PROTEIN SUBUNIT P38-LIKE PROTEIN [Salix viminalis]KAJ6672877.1 RIBONUCLEASE P PROTEIN SUBUNIT P38-LIKE PROTEIN [Salix viminalis]
MDGKEVSGSYLMVSEGKSESFYPIEEEQIGQCELLHKLETAEKEIMELKKIRREDAKANEKVSKDKAVEEEEHKRKEVEENLAKAEKIAEELRETAKRQAQEHSTDLWKHKTAFLELVSNHRQLEAEMGRALRQLEAKRQELDAVLEQKEESVLLTQKLSVEVLKMRKDLEQKDKILSAMLRKSKMDTTEKELLLKEVKLSKAKRKQAELERERWKSVSESKHERHSLRSMFSHHSNPRLDDPPIERGASQGLNSRSQSIDYDIEYENPEFQKSSKAFSPLSNLYSPGNDELADVKRLEGWVRSEAEKVCSCN